MVIGVDDTFPFSLLTPLIEAFYQHHSVTRLIFINGVLGGSWDALTQGRRTFSSVRSMSLPS